MQVMLSWSGYGLVIVPRKMVSPYCYDQDYKTGYSILQLRSAVNYVHPNSIHEHKEDKCIKQGTQMFF